MNVIRVRELRFANCVGCVFWRADEHRCTRSRIHIPDCDIEMASIYIEDTPQSKAAYAKARITGVTQCDPSSTSF